jgi:hypothetical protein
VNAETLVLFPIEDHGKMEQESREIYELGGMQTFRQVASTIETFRFEKY